MEKDKLRIGIIGIGWYALSQHVPNFHATGQAEVVAISRRSEEALASAKEELGVDHAFTDWHDLLAVDGLNAVVVATAGHAHAEPAIAALKRGIPVLVEKPMALTYAAARAMVEASEQTGTMLRVGYNRRTSESWRAAREALEGGIIGTVRHVNLAFSLDLTIIWLADRIPESLIEQAPKGFYGDGRLEGYWRRNPEESGGGAFVEGGTHMVDLGLWLGGAPASTVSAFTENAGLPVERIVSAQARLANGVLLSLCVADGIQGKGKGRLTIFGDGGTMTADWQGWKNPDEIWIETKEEKTQLNVEPSDSNTAAEFVSGLLGKTPHLASAREGANAVAFTEATYISAADGRWVEAESL